MKIKSIRVKNFSSFFGDISIDMSTTGAHNVVLIGGNNGAGKTSLFTAIKLALYGPLSFHFQDKNNQYTAKIKSLINHNAYLQDVVEAAVEVSVLLSVGHEEQEFKIKRAWKYENKHLSEDYSVVRSGVTLTVQELDFFQNYLYSAIPPNLFDFFFFDGEEIGNFFATSSYSTYLKNAVLTLNGYDTFGLLQRFCDSYVGEEEGNADYNKTAEELADANAELDSLIGRRDSIVLNKAALEEQLRTAQEALSALDSKFKAAGGINKEEREALIAEQAASDKVKQDCAHIIRNFFETFMPVFITRSLAIEVDNQLKQERQVAQYRSVKDLLSVDLFYEALTESHTAAGDKQELASYLSEYVLNKLAPKSGVDQIQTIHDLSEDQYSGITAILQRLNGFVPEHIIDACERHRVAMCSYDTAAKTLRESLPEVDAEQFYIRQGELSLEIRTCEERIPQAESELCDLEIRIAAQSSICERLKKELQAKARDKTAIMYTSRISEIMKMMISDVTDAMFSEIEQQAIDMFKKIIRKENFIHRIELDKNFGINLYKKQDYSSEEIGFLIRNVGYDGLERRLGSVGMSELLAHFSLQSREELATVLPMATRDKNQISMLSETLHLYNRMELNQLSKGEKQVFILCLYWAIIKTSKQHVPFVIDTPFARIDTEHREQISKVFFPQISDQVIILSTDEEVVGPYREVLFEHIAHEYLLEYDVKDGRTIVSKGYFAEV